MIEKVAHSMMDLPVVYNKSLLSFVNQHITDPILYAYVLQKAQYLLDKQEEAQSKERIQKRCLHVKEEIMMRVWHPSRIEKLLDLGYDIEDI